MKIALAGNPNSGKTTFYNTLTGKTAHVGNWPGVTVDIKEGPVKKRFCPEKTKITVIDLPGAYSLSPFTSEETITKRFIRHENPDVIINIVDATNLMRSLFFTTQLLELGIPVIIALNKDNLNIRKGVSIDTETLSSQLDCPVIRINILKADTPELAGLIRNALETAGTGRRSASARRHGFGGHMRMHGKWKAHYGRFSLIKTVVAAAERRQTKSDARTFQDRVDRIVTHKLLGIPIFAFIIWLVFSISQVWAGPLLADLFTAATDWLYGMIENALSGQVHPVLRSLLLEGIIGGVGALLGFLPLIMVLFFCLALLEDCGYIARAAVVMDRYFKKIGLSGRSIIPMVVGTGCAIPGIMATRTIKNDRQRRTTIMLTPFMPCGAKLPVIALIAGVFFRGNIWIGTSMYFLAIAVIIISGIIVRKITGDVSQSFFIMELPDYRFPGIKRSLLSMLDRAREFIIKAGTIILVCNAIIHLLQTFNWHFRIVSETAPETSILATLASPVSFIFIPLGFGLWQFAAASITGFIARENVVGTLAVTFSITNFINPENPALVSGGNDILNVFGISAAAGLAYLVFNLFIPPCFAAIGAMRAEMESRKWFWSALAYQLGTGYALAFLLYQTGTLIATGKPGAGFIPGLCIALGFAGILLLLMRRGEKRTEIRRSDGIQEA
ncbi:MAG: ferrous iron transporter B [Spirochaetales bacterium]|nr:ferrous iron transporter B [Spirochaetales bacterium]